MDSLEKEIIEAVQAGNPERFALLYDRYIKKIYNFIYFKTLHKQTAEDLTSEVFYKVLKSIRTFDTSKSFSSWIYRIAQNAVIDHYRTFKRTEDIEDVWDVAGDDDFIANLDDRMTFEKVKEHLSELNAAQRDIVLMRIWHEMSYKEIAEIVGKSETNCKVIFSRAVSSLRAEVLVSVLIILSAQL